MTEEKRNFFIYRFFGNARLSLWQTFKKMTERIKRGSVVYYFNRPGKRISTVGIFSKFRAKNRIFRSSWKCFGVKSGSVWFPVWTALSHWLLYLSEMLSLLFVPSSAESRVWLFTYLSARGERCRRCQAACRLLQLTTSLLTHHSYISSKPGIILF